MKKTKNSKGYFIYKCRNCGEEFYSGFIDYNIDEKFEEIIDEGEIQKYKLFKQHDCNEVQTGLADLIGYTEYINLNKNKEDLKC